MKRNLDIYALKTLITITARNNVYDFSLRASGDELNVMGNPAEQQNKYVVVKKVDLWSLGFSTNLIFPHQLFDLSSVMS